MSRNVNNGGFNKEDSDLVAKTVKFDVAKKAADHPEDKCTEKLPLKEGSPSEHKLPKEVFDKEAKRDNAQIAQDFREFNKEGDEIDESKGGFMETITDAKDKALDLASKGIEAVKDQASNAAEFIKEKASDIKENLLEKKENGGKMIETGVEAAQEKAAQLGENFTDAKDKAVDLASKGFEAVKGQVSNAVEYIKDHTAIDQEGKIEGNETEQKIAEAQKDIQKNMSIEKVEAQSKGIPEISHAIKRAGSLRPEKTPEQIAQEKYLAEKRSAEQHELLDAVNEAAETIKSHTLPHTTKSKADQIREQAAMIEAARGMTKLSKGKGVNHQVVQHAKADFDYIERLQEEGEKAQLHDEEENIRNLIDDHEMKIEQSEPKQLFLTQKKKVLKKLAKEAKGTVRQKKLPSKGLSGDQKSILSALAHEAAMEVQDNDPSSSFPSKDDETFPLDEFKRGYDEEDMVDDYGRSLISTLKEKASKAADWIKKKVGSRVEEASDLKEEAKEKLEEEAERPLGLAERFKEKLHDAAEWVASKVSEQTEQKEIASSNIEKEGSLKDNSRQEKLSH